MTLRSACAADPFIDQRCAANSLSLRAGMRTLCIVLRLMV